MSQTVILRTPFRRDQAKALIDRAPESAIVTIKPPARSTDQNSKMWALLSDISRAKPEGRTHIPEVWKQLFMAGLGYEVKFEMGLDNRPFPTGFKTSRLSKHWPACGCRFIKRR